MEKIKDILHDFSDVLTAVFIAVLMFGVVVWNLGDWFDKDSIASAINTIPVVEKDPTEEPELPRTKEDEREDIEENSEDTKEVESLPEKQEEKPKDQPIGVIVVDSKSITIPNGTPGVGIAKILLENGLIENTQDFVKTAEELHLALKLKSGTFDIPVNSTLEEIVKIIAGRN